MNISQPERDQQEMPSGRFPRFCILGVITGFILIAGCTAQTATGSAPAGSTPSGGTVHDPERTEFPQFRFHHHEQ